MGCVRHICANFVPGIDTPTICTPACTAKTTRIPISADPPMTRFATEPHRISQSPFRLSHTTKVLAVLSSTTVRPDSRSPCRYPHLRSLASRLGKALGLVTRSGWCVPVTHMQVPLELAGFSVEEFNFLKPTVRAHKVMYPGTVVSHADPLHVVRFRRLSHLQNTNASSLSKEPTHALQTMFVGLLNHHPLKDTECRRHIEQFPLRGLQILMGIGHNVVREVATKVSTEKPGDLDVLYRDVDTGGL